jgi:hypothetical protein
VSGETTFDHVAPGRVHITVREDREGAAGFLGLVVVIVAALYLLMPSAQERPTG